MAKIVELFGVPGSGKSYLRNTLVPLLKEQGVRVMGRPEAIRQCLQRRDDGVLTGLFKKLPHRLWNRVIHQHYCLSEYKDFVAVHPKLTVLFSSVLIDHNVSQMAMQTIMGAFINTCVEWQLLETFAREDELILLDEGFCHRLFTLYGNLRFPCDQKGIEYYMEHIPLALAAIFIATPSHLCLDRLRQRADLPVLLQGLDEEGIRSRLENGTDLFQHLVRVLSKKSIHCYQYDGQSSDFSQLIYFCRSVSSRPAALT